MFRVGDEERRLGPGGTWQILGGVPHSVTTGPEGALVIDVFAPPRADWDALPTVETDPPDWPG
jgi:quercetin dioxygenase-like cupin family protein